jgi:DNA uptake protein ComE-like DNA-binding protein
MQIGDLSRARTTAKPRINTAYLAVSAISAIGLALTGWLALAAPQEEGRAVQETAALTALQDQDDATMSSSAPESKQPSLPQVASAVADSSFGSALASSSPVETAQAPAYAGNTPVSPEPGTFMPPAERASADAQPPVAVPAPATPPPSEVTGTVTAAANPEQSSQPSDGLVDLNSASFEVLNSLPGGGPIGRAIIKGRPYTSAEELVTRKVLRRSVYEKIKDQVTAR